MDDIMEDPAIEDSQKYKVKIKEFEGPLDLLLHLVKNSEINIYEISIAEITGQYLEYMALLVTMDLENIADFIDMASTLILIKSRTLLPVDVKYEEDEEDPREELIAKLLEYQKFKIAAGVLEERSDEVNIVAKKNEPVLFDVSEDDESNWKPLSILELVGSFANVLNKNYQVKEKKYEIEHLEFTVEDKINYIASLLKGRGSFNFFEIIHENMHRMELVCTFLAILETVKKGMISAKQHKIFGDIYIVKRDDYIQPEENVVSGANHDNY